MDTFKNFGDVACLKFNLSVTRQLAIYTSLFHRLGRKKRNIQANKQQEIEKKHKSNTYLTEPSTFWRNQRNFDHMHEFHISQSTAVTFFQV